MLRPEQDLANRRPVWEAMSELYLDNELSPELLEQVAETLAASPYTARELESILLAEVHPVCAVNLRQVAGVWSGFDGDWLHERIVRRQRARFRWPARLVPLRQAQRNIAASIFVRMEALRRGR